jgi:hypothetical protein
MTTDAQRSSNWMATLLPKGKKLAYTLAGGTLGLVGGTMAWSALTTAALVTVTCNCSALPAGKARVTGSYTCPNTTEVVPVDLGELEFPRPTIETQIPEGCTLRLGDVTLNGVTYFGSSLYAPTSTDPTPTPTTEPTRTTEPTPTGTPPAPAPVPAGCSTVMAAKDAVGNQWSILAGGEEGGGHVWLVTPDGTANYAFPGGGAIHGAAAVHLILTNGVVYGRESTSRGGQYFKLIGRNQVALETPVCTATPTPTTTPTPTPPPPVIVQATVTGRTCNALLAAPKPATALGTGWRVQYFAGTTSLTTAHYTIARVVTLPAKVNDTLRAEWTKDTVRIVQQLAPVICEVR